MKIKLMGSAERVKLKDLEAGTIIRLDSTETDILLTGEGKERDYYYLDDLRRVNPNCGNMNDINKLKFTIMGKVTGIEINGVRD